MQELSRLVLLLLSLSRSLPTQTDVPLVAFVFSGAARSFVMPPVHESIRHNLIDAFCPPQSCERRIFLRISSTDNVHQLPGIGVLTDAHGFTMPVPPDRIREIEHAVGRLVLDEASARKELHVRWTSTGGDPERAEMTTHFSGFRHKIFRELDPRRYSMYFHRWASFRMATEYEAEHGVRFDWVVMARMDMLWGSPIKHNSLWAPDKVWMMSHWQVAIPDGFALIPRRFAEAFFSMETLVRPGVFCLGGPNFDTKSLSPENLKRLGFTSDQVDTVIGESCGKRCPLEPACGYSEQILSRKVVQEGITNANLGFAALFAVIVRYPLIPDCNRLRPDYLIARMRSIQTANTALHSGCRTLFSDIKTLNSRNFSSCGRIGLWSKIEYSGSCLLNRHQSGFEFLPFRIKMSLNKTQPSQCLSYHRKEDKSYVFKFERCIEQEPIILRKASFVFKYGRQQHFHFYPLSKGLQFIKFADPENNYVHCLSYQGSRIGATACDEFSLRFFLKDKRFRSRRIKLREPAHFNLAERVSFILPAQPNQRTTLCLSLSWSSLRNNTESDVELLPCKMNKRRGNALTSRSQIFTIERTRTEDNTITKVKIA